MVFVLVLAFREFVRTVTLRDAFFNRNGIVLHFLISEDDENWIISNGAPIICLSHV